MHVFKFQIETLDGERIQCGLSDISHIFLDYDVIYINSVPCQLSTASPITPGTCVWTQDSDDDGTWYTACGDAFRISTGSPSENKMRYCHHCGKPIEEICP